MIFVTLYLIFSFGRIEIGLLTALPMFSGWLLTLGFMGLTGIRFNIFNIIISSFIFGLGVDYSILMMRGLLHKYKYGEDLMHNYRVSVFLSSATTVIGVAVLFFARHPALNSIALVAVFGVSSVVLVTWTLEPLLVKWMLFDRKAKGESPVFGRAFLHSIFIAWIPISSIAVILVIYASLISPLLPIRKKRKQQLFHTLFNALSRFYIATNFPRYHRVENDLGEDFGKPAIIIANHQSLIETPALLRLHPNIVILTNEWVFNHWVFGPVARVAGFIPIREGIEDALEVMKQRTDEGYSILIFPEGSRSMNGHIQRFHRGAFYVAEKLGLDILPVLIFGSGDFLRKTDFWGKPNRLFMKIMPRIRPDDKAFGTTYQERARAVRQYYLREYASYRAHHATTSYYRRTVIHNYLFKGPVLEWYVRIKMTLEDNFRLYHENLPVTGDLLDLGCGYGYVVYMLAFTAKERTITGVDHDEEKIRVAQNCHSRSERITFIHADVTRYSFPDQDGIILGDVLHYLQEDDQRQLLIRCMDKLRPGGVLMIREGFRDAGRKHSLTKLTEFFSTRLGFNKTRDSSKQLHFISMPAIIEIATARGMEVIVLTSKKHSSNQLIKIIRPSHDI
jgi:1-acyl-sn-glycerol-3-phosphate acyltransferase